jgi:hypothetical protein
MRPRFVQASAAKGRAVVVVVVVVEAALVVVAAAAEGVNTLSSGARHHELVMRVCASTRSVQRPSRFWGVGDWSREGTRGTESGAAAQTAGRAEEEEED